VRAARLPSIFHHRKEIVMQKSARILAPAIAALAFAAPAAHAMPAIDAPNHNSPAAVTAPVATAASSDDGFDLGSAAIGAGSLAGLIALLSAGAAATGRVRLPSAR
jgi:hypothetical protein